MALNILDKIPIENFTIENNIVKGVHQDIPESYQIGQIFFDVFASKPDHVSQIEAETDERTTFAEMKENSVRCALWLKKQGIGRGDVVTICCENLVNAYIPVLATFYVGAIHNAWNFKFSLQEVRRFMSTLQPKVIFATRKNADVILQAGKAENFHGKIVVFDSHPGLLSLKVLMQEQTNEEVQQYQPQTLTNPEDIACIILSSGSTGVPKIVAHIYDTIVSQIVSFTPYAMKGVCLLYSNWFWISGFFHRMQNILSRGTMIMHRQFDPEETCKVIEKYKVEYLFLSPPALILYSKLDVLKRQQLKSLKLVVTGGAKVHDHILEKFHEMLPHVTLTNRIGATELGRVVLAQTDKSKARGSVGFVMSNTEVKICDLVTGKVLGPNIPGELCVKSKKRIKGYYNDEKVTKAAFDDEGWYHTGDLAYYNESGEFFIVDRITEGMLYRSHRIWPNEIEAVLLTHPDVIEVAVVPIPHEVDGDHPMAFVQKLPGSEVTEEELVKLSERLGEMKKLHGGVKFLEEMPRRHLAKVDRQTLKEWAKMIKQN